MEVTITFFTFLLKLGLLSYFHFQYFLTLIDKIMQLI